MKIVTILAQFALTSFLVFANGCSLDDESDVHGIIESNAKELLINEEIHSASIGIYRNGKSYTGHFGELDPGKGNIPNDSTIYEVASISKTFTGTLVAQAIVEGKLGLDDDIRNHLNRPFPNLEFEGQAISVRHLLSHMGGLPRTFPDSSELWENPNFDTLPFELNRRDKEYTKAKFLNDLSTVELTEAPGHEYTYSNAGPNLIAHLLETIYGEEFDSLLRKVIFEKAEMKTTKLHLSDSEKSLLANGYNANGLLMPHFVNPLWGAAGGYKSTLPDLMKYVEFQFSPANPLLKRFFENVGGDPDRYHSYHWNVRILEDGSKQITAHGGAYGTQTWVAIYPMSKTAIVVVTNVSDSNTAQKISELTPWR